MSSEPATNTVSLALSKDELEIVSNALNEVCHGLDIAEFSIRMGAEKHEVLRLFNRIAAALDRMQ